jgi:phosphoesterase RecJ-like protein
MTDKLEAIAKAIKASRSITVIAHIATDGDTLGAGLALFGALKSLDKEVQIVCEDVVPHIYAFMPMTEYVLEPHQAKCSDMVIAVDCADTERMGNAYELFKAAKCNASIDHHLSGCGYAQLNAVDPHASATGELIYELILRLDAAITPEIATCLYVAISTDTGHFMYTNTTERSMEIAGKLISCGVDIAETTRNLYRTRTLSKTLLLGCMLSKLEFFHNNKICTVLITQTDMDRSASPDEDTEGLIDYMRDIEGVQIAIFFREYPGGYIKASLRAKTNADMSALAAQFAGGGHKGAAGFKVTGEPYEHLFPRVIALAGNLLDQY